MAAFFSSLMIVLQPMNLFMLTLCAVIGCILGAIPGLSGGLGISLILPMTFALNTELSFCMLLGMYVGGISGSFIAAVLVGIPGSAASIATCYDGYPMTQKGKAAKALTIGITGSFIGTFISVIVATLSSSLLADVALMLGPWEYFSLCFMAISLVVGLSRGSIFKGLLGAFLGVWLSTIGADSVTNSMRFTFGNYNLYAGIPVVCLLLGTFALQQVACSYAQGQQEMPEINAGELKGFGLTLKDFTENIKAIASSLFIGLWIGFLPGMGSGVSNMIAYGQAKKMSKNPDEFGTGVDAGVWASEVANNAGVGGALIPMMSLGIPGDGTCVLLLSAMTIHGLQAGPLFISQNPSLSYMIFAAVLVSAVLIFFIELLTKRWFPYLLKAPYHYLYSAILMICFVGAFSSTTSQFSIYLMLIFGVVGIILDIAEIPMSPLMLAYILGSNLETYFRRGCSYAAGDMTTFFTRPVSCIFLVIGIYSLFKPLVVFLIKKSKAVKGA
ncbi:tripartite tricarboxylate transporter permease [Lachnotalea glycerini]|uniref:Tat pathway signal protein n=1 Tax=Lachnotalea glycerini TaxID=1763509 RepID=A0A371JGH3_9FIRM|nr:tripartite tricarboxylate transporter permease [Lachnotalea glycerini]RDY31851.1 Tat pathway signal protein [Lachnotalea glycerini]